MKLYKIEYKIKGKWYHWVTVSDKDQAERIARDSFKSMKDAEAWRIEEELES